MALGAPLLKTPCRHYLMQVKCEKRLEKIFFFLFIFIYYIILYAY